MRSWLFGAMSSYCFCVARSGRWKLVIRFETASYRYDQPLEYIATGDFASAYMIVADNRLFSVTIKVMQRMST
jgi:hypothetical protein